MDYCTLDCIQQEGHLNNHDTCEFVMNNCNQDTVQFIQVYFCVFKNSFMVLLTIGTTILVGLFEMLSFLADGYLCPCVDKLVISFGFSETLAGVTFLAFANGAPDVLTAIIAGNSESESTALIPFGSIFGALLFSSTFILAKVIVHSPPVNGIPGVKAARGQTIKPILFYIFTTLLMLFISIIFKQMRWYFASIFLVLYVVYGIMVMLDEKKKKKFLKEASLLTENDSEDVLNPVIESATVVIEQQQKAQDALVDKPEDTQVNKVKRIFRIVLRFIFKWTIPSYDEQNWNIYTVLVQMLLSTLFLFASQGMITNTINGIPLIALAQAVVLLLFGLMVLLCKKQPPKRMWIFQIYSFIVIVLWISYVCSVLINVLELYQLITAIDPVFIGLTLLAFGNSIGDYFSIVAFAKLGKGMTSIAGVYSGQLFNLLIGLGTSYLIRSIRKGAYTFDLFPASTSTSQTLNNSIIWFVIGMSILNLTISLVYLFRQKFFFGKKFSTYLLIFYASFCVITSLLAISSDMLGEVQCDYKPDLSQWF